jgi:hypothetical protein
MLLDLEQHLKNFRNNLEVNAKKQEENLLKSEKNRNFPSSKMATSNFPPVLKTNQNRTSVFQNWNFQFSKIGTSSFPGENPNS